MIKFYIKIKQDQMLKDKIKKNKLKKIKRNQKNKDYN